MRTLAIDIETSPNLAYVWSLWDQHVGLNQIAATTEMLCFAAKWLGERKVHFHSQHDDGREAMVRRAWELLDEADVLLHYNGRNFDVKHLNREFVTMGLGPPSPYDQIDLLQVVRKRFKFPSNKLAYVSEALGLDGKAETGGFELWRRCLADDETAWRTMRKYNVQDVRLLEELYDVLQAWIPSHPSRTLHDGTTGCPVCGVGVDKLQRRGFRHTKVSRFQRWHCTSCGAYSHSGKREDGVDLRQAA